MNVTYIKVFVDWLDAIEPLGDAERGRLFTSLLEYARTGAVPQLNGNERFIFPMMRAQVARDIAQMEATSENRGKRKKANEDLSDLSDKSNLSGKRTQEKDKDKDEDKDKDKDEDEDEDKEGSPPTPSQFIPPNVIEVRAYCNERKNHVDPQRFVDFYTSKGWMVGKTKMKDWKAAVRTWEKSDKQTGRKDNGFQTSNPFLEMLQEERGL